MIGFNKSRFMLVELKNGDGDAAETISLRLRSIPLGYSDMVRSKLPAPTRVINKNGTMTEIEDPGAAAKNHMLVAHVLIGYALADQIETKPLNLSSCKADDLKRYSEELMSEMQRAGLCEDHLGKLLTAVMDLQNGAGSLGN